MNLYVKGTESGFYIIHTDASFDPICGYMSEQRDAIRAKELLSMALSDADSVYENRKAIADIILGLRWDIRELSEHMETRARACNLRDIADLAESRLTSVTRPR